VTSRYAYRQFMAAVVGCSMMLGWTIAFATVEAMPPQLINLPWIQMLIGIAVASWGGATATLSRYLTAMYEARPFHWKSEATKDVFVSGTVGTGTYLTGWVETWHIATLGIALLLAGFLGVRLLSFAAERFMKLLDKP
jgi:hypothetical protein